jgi:hypothetical protein
VVAEMSEENSNTLPAGWYPDTDLADTERYWDGKAWTNKRRATNISPEKKTHKVFNSSTTSSSSRLKDLWQVATGKPDETKGKKALRRIVSFFLLIMILGAMGGSTDSTVSSSPSVTESPTSAPTISETPTTEPTPTESTSPTPIPLSPVEFRVSALGEIADMKKDFSDFEVVLNKGGLFRLLGNILEIEFNIGQLQSLTPPDQYSAKFIERLSKLETAVEGLSSAVTEPDSSTSNTKNWLSKSRSALSSLEAFLKSVD